MVRGPVAAAPKCLLEMQNCRTHPRLPKAEPEIKVSQVLSMNITIGKALRCLRRRSLKAMMNMREEGRGRRGGLRILLGGQRGQGAQGGLCPAAPNKGTKSTAQGFRSPEERALVCRRCHAPSLLPRPPQSASAGLLAGHRPCPTGFDGPSSAAKAWSSRERGWVRLLAANREAGEGWLLAFWARRHRTGRRAGSRLAVGSRLGPGPAGSRLRQDAEDSTH